MPPTTSDENLPLFAPLLEHGGLLRSGWRETVSEDCFTLAPGMVALKAVFLLAARVMTPVEGSPCLDWRYRGKLHLLST